MARSDDIVLRPGDDGAFLIPDRLYPRAFTLRVGRTDQSYVDLDDPTRLDFDYIQRMADAVDQLAPPGERLRVVHVGGALMTLPRYVAHTRPSSAQIVLEPDAELTTFVREHVPLPTRSGIKVRDVDGRAGIAALRDGFCDLVVVDAFDGARVPAELTTLEFLNEVARIVTEQGSIMINITDRMPLAYSRRVVAGVQQLFPYVVLSAEPATLKGRRFGNLIVLGSRVPLPVQGLARTAAGSAFPYRVVSGEALQTMINKAKPFTDADPEQSPDPVRGLAHFG